MDKIHLCNFLSKFYNTISNNENLYKEIRLKTKKKDLV